MKIRTEDELQDVIDSEIAWRKKELSAVKANINTARNFAKNTALRAGITLLYAHWEGAIKNLAYYYLVYVSSLKIPYNRLKPNFLAITLKNDIRHFDETQKVTLQKEIVNKLLCRYNQGSNIPTENIISANSNLNSTIFTEIMSAIGLPTDEYEKDYVLIDEVLLKMRNKIAHGDNLESLSLLSGFIGNSENDFSSGSICKGNHRLHIFDAFLRQVLFELHILRFSCKNFFYSHCNTSLSLAAIATIHIIKYPQFSYLPLWKSAHSSSRS